MSALNRFREPPIHLAVKGGHQPLADLLRQSGYAPPHVAPIAKLIAKADDAIGKAVFAKHCRDCHDPNKTMLSFRGPPLWGVLGRAKAGIEGFKYSGAMRTSGGVWSYEEMNQFFAEPASIMPGTDMGSLGVQDDGERAALIAYLRLQSDAPAEFPDP